MKTMIIYPDVEIWNFVLEGIDGERDVELIPLNRYCNLFQLLCRKYLGGFRMPSALVLGSVLRKKLSGLKKNDSLIICDYTDLVFNGAIRKCVKQGVSVNLWFWNSMESNITLRKQIVEIKAIGRIPVYTFDKKDAKEYGLCYLNQIYPIFKHLEENAVEPCSDFYFLGCDKQRAPILEDLKNVLANYKCDFRVINAPKDYITYKENIDNVKRTRCVVDIVQTCQVGLTLRPLEALTFRKKLITNNRDIIHYDFYNHKNIFVLGVDPVSNLESFMAQPYVDIPKDVLMKYDVNRWVETLSQSTVATLQIKQHQ